MKEFTVTHSEEGLKLAKYLSRLLPEAGSGFVYRMLRKKNITLNDAKADANAVLSEGDVIRVWFSDETFAKFAGNRSESPDAAGQKLQVIWSDMDVVVIDKPAGLLSQKSAPGDLSVNELLEAWMRENGRGTDSTVFRPSVCHRLDRNTSGLLVCGISEKGLRCMSEAIKSRDVTKEYLCLVEGETPDVFTLSDHLEKDRASNVVRVVDPGKPDSKEALLHAKTLGSAGGISLVLIELVTGRSHQIRVQMAHYGHPILGDVKYGLSPRSPHKRPMLHAFRLSFGAGLSAGPVGRTLEAPLPADMEKIMKGAGIVWRPGIHAD